MANVSEVERLIAEERDMLAKQLAEAIRRRDEANEDVKELRARFDAAPRLHVRRSRKAKAPTLPSALEMFPLGIERTDGDADV